MASERPRFSISWRTIAKRSDDAGARRRQLVAAFGVGLAEAHTTNALRNPACDARRLAVTARRSALKARGSKPSDQHRASRYGHRLPALKAQLGDERGCESKAKARSPVEHRIAQAVENRARAVPRPRLAGRVGDDRSRRRRRGSSPLASRDERARVFGNGTSVYSSPP